MSHSALQHLVGRAIVDKEFCGQLFNGLRTEAVADFELTDAERNAVLAIQAATLEEFAAELDYWIEYDSPVSDIHARLPVPACRIPR